MDNQKSYVLPDGLAPSSLLDEIKKAYALTEAQSYSSEQNYYDTFDWRLYNKNLALFRDDSRYVLEDIDSGSALNFIKRKKNQRHSQFWWEYPESEFRDKLKSLLDVRALMPLVCINKRERVFNILNKDEKTVLRCVFEAGSLDCSGNTVQLENRIKLCPVKGYRKIYKDLPLFLKDLGLLADSNSRHVLFSALKIEGKIPSDYTSKIKVQLVPDSSLREAAVIILKQLLHIMMQNEAGMKADIDSEFLHDFRVSIRRTRSALCQIKKIFPQEISCKFVKGFAHLGKLTNKMRDYDVCLLRKEKYMHMLPKELRAGLVPFFAGVQARRKQEYAHLLKELNSATYKKFLNSWQAFLDEAETLQSTKNSNKSARKLAIEFINKRHKRIIQNGEAIDDETPDNEIHNVRIECKKLRYLMEFFAPLFDASPMQSLVTQLKMLQENLGNFNDLSIQINALNARLHKLPHKRASSIKTAAALGGLIASLNNEKKIARNNFDAAFHKFSGKSNMALFEKLLEQP